MNSALSGYFAQIRDARVVSFDIFDTLITRTVASPSDVFKLVSPRMAEFLGFPISEFSALRVRCEKNVKQLAFDHRGIDDISLYEIYEEIFKKLGVVADVDRACLIEMECERQVLVPRNLGKSLFEFARSENKEIVLISDMYLPKDFISSVLNTLGFEGWVKFYLSVDYGKSKSSGSLFDVVLSDLKLEPEMLTHIGDNPRGDISVPHSLGIRTMHIPRTVQQLNERFSFGRKVHEVLVRNDRSISSSVTAQLLSDKIFAEPVIRNAGALNGDPFLFGYCSLGPLFCGFSAWLRALAASRGVDKILFLSRDGKVAQQVFMKMFGAHDVAVDYCYASRRVARVCSISNRWDIERILNEALYSTDLATYLDFRFGLEVDTKDNALLRELGFDGIHQKIGAKVNKEKLFEFLIANEDRIYEGSKNQRSAYKEYLCSLVGNSENIMLVDIGYSGSMQACISELLGKSVEGAYLATSLKTCSVFSLDPNTVHAYLDSFATNINNSGHFGINSHRFFYETVICSDEDSFEGFEFNGDVTFFKFWHSGADARKRFVRLAHAGAVAFASDLAQRWEAFDECYFLTPQQACVFLDSFLKMPPPNDIPVFYDVEFEDKFGPDLKRVLCASPKLIARGIRLQEIWPEAVKLKPMIVVGEEYDFEILSTPVGISVKRAKITSRRELFFYKLYMHIERSLLKKSLSEKKYRKYHLNRSRFFAESGNRAVRAYGRVTVAL